MNEAEIILRLHGIVMKVSDECKNDLSAISDTIRKIKNMNKQIPGEEKMIKTNTKTETPSVKLPKTPTTNHILYWTDPGAYPPKANSGFKVFGNEQSMLRWINSFVKRRPKINVVAWRKCEEIKLKAISVIEKFEIHHG